MATMPVQKPGQSKQDYGTPSEFLTAVRSLLGIGQFGLDIAASAENAVCESYYDEEMNALAEGNSWLSLDGEVGWSWLNPPYADIYPWAKKAYEESQRGAKIAMLVPLSIAKWWVDWVDGKAAVLMLNGRITFVGESKPYPKDCALILYSPQNEWIRQLPPYRVWEWKAVRRQHGQL